MGEKVGLDQMKILAGSSNAPLAEAIASALDVSVSTVKISRFKDSEIFVKIEENVRGMDVFLVQSTSNPSNDFLMEMLIIIDALRRASAHRITAVMPYFGYARQDRKTGGRTPISAKLVANLITRAGADRVFTLDLHARQIQGFFDIPTDNLSAVNEIKRDMLARGLKENITMISPDIGGVVRVRQLADGIGAPIAIVDKRRPRPNEVEVMNIIGEVDGRDCIILDDIVDTGGTLAKAAGALIEQGATSVTAYCTHGVLSDPAVETISNSALRELVITDSIKSRSDIDSCSNIRRISVAGLFGEAIRRIANNESISKLFEKDQFF